MMVWGLRLNTFLHGKGGKLYHFKLPYLPENKAKLSQFLSTFKFTNQPETADWKTYRNDGLGFEIKYLPAWKIDGNRSTNQTIVFDTGIAESRESIAVQAANVTLQQWKNNLDQSVIISSQVVNVGGETGLQVNTSEFGAKLLAVIYADKLYIITTSGLMLENKMIDTFKFTN
jgi:hypothetical protein